MAVIIFNVRGIVMLAIAFAAAFGVGALFGFDGEGPLMMMAGPLAAIIDLIYRYKVGGKQWFSSQGGSLFFLPVWCFGVLWFVLGIIYTIGTPTDS